MLEKENSITVKGNNQSEKKNECSRNNNNDSYINFIGIFIKPKTRKYLIP